MLIHIPSAVPQSCRCRVIQQIMRTHSTKGSHKKLLAVKGWQPRWHLRSGRGNGRGEPREEVGKIQRCPNITNCLPRSHQVLQIFCVLCQNHTQEEMGIFAGFLLYIGYRDAYVYSNLVQLILPNILNVFHSLQTTG